MNSFLHSLFVDQSGQDTVEYAVIAALIALSAIAALTNFNRFAAKDLKSVTKSFKKYA